MRKSAAADGLANTEPGKAGKERKKIAGSTGVKTAHDGTGAYDLIAYIEGGDISELGNTIVSQIQSIDGITQTMTSVVVELP